jgi:hypothetical protein
MDKLRLLRDETRSHALLTKNAIAAVIAKAGTTAA